MTSTWEDVFRALDQWEVVPKLNRLHTKSNSINTESTGFVHLCSPDIAHLMVNTHGTIRLFHHFHHDADDGLNDGTNALWALLGGGGFAAAMAVDTKQIVRSHVGTPYDWSKMLTWNSTSDVRRAIEELVTTRSSVSGVSAPDRHRRRRGATSCGSDERTPQEGSAPRGRSKSSKHTNETNDQDKTNDADADDTEDVTVVGFTMKPTVPVPAFIAAAIMESYVTDPEELALMIVRTIKQRASEDPDPDRASRLAEAASYVPRWVLCVAASTRTTHGPTKWGVAASSAYSRRADDWAKVLHMKYLAVKAKSLIQSDDQSETPGRENDAIRNLSSLLERQVASAVASSPQIPKTGFDSFPVDKADDPVRFGEGRLGRTPTRPVRPSQTS
ncbi:hypothetical protein MHU86_25491 [Fragilaria crotonensis]|nr:hypothetical protein MHU86_25491 [Fragilaria crotonensis]